MCSKCQKIDIRIERYDRIRATIGDQLTVDRIKEFVADLRTEKGRLHPQEDRS